MNKCKLIIYVSADGTSSLADQISAVDREITKLKSDIKPNENNSKALEDVPLTTAAMGALTAMLTVIGVTLVPFLSVAPLAIGVVQYLIKKQEQTSSSQEASLHEADSDEEFANKAAQVLNQLSLNQLQTLVEVIPFSSLSEEFEFPPGHPFPENIYRVHPLKSKSRKYIPLESFYALLYDERETELIRLLTDLGATKIVIQEVTNESNEQEANANVQFTGIGGGEGSFARAGKQSGVKARTIQLRGKPWTSNLTLAMEKYSWLPYEPKWEALVHARIYGGALSDSIELTSDISHSIGGKLKLAEGLLQNIADLGSGVKTIKAHQKRQLFEVEFADSIEDSKG